MKNIISKDMGKQPGNKKPPLDLAPFLARGFGDNIDKLIANAPVDGIDRYHTWSQVRLASETADFLYNGFSRTTVKYFQGNRPILENILDGILQDTRNMG